MWLVGVKEKKKLCSWFPSVNAYEAFERDLALINEDAKMLDCGYLLMLSSQVLLYAPNWFARYDYKGRKIALVRTATRAARDR